MNKGIKNILLLVLFAFTVILAGKVLADASNNNSNAGKITVNKTATKEIGVDGNETYGRKANVTLSVTGNEFTTASTLDVVLVIDRSSSMNEKASNNDTKTKMQATKTAAISLVQQLLANNTSNRTVVQMGIVTFGTNIIEGYNSNGSYKRLTSESLTSSSNTITTMINNIPDTNSNQGTNIQSGLERAKTLLASSTAKNKVVILLTDGEPTFFNYEGIENTLGTGTSDSAACVEYTKQEVCYKGYCYEHDVCSKEVRPSEAAKAEATAIKDSNVTLYTVGFGIAKNTNAKSFLQEIATKNEAPYYLLAENADELAKTFNDIVKSITTIAKDVVVTDTVPAGFIVDEEALKNTYKDKVTITKGENDTTIITWNIGELSVTTDPVLTYQVTAKDDYYGGMYTNVEAILTGTATEGNPAYPNRVINETFPLPIVAIPMITNNDNYTAKLGELLTINESQGILKNDTENQLTDGTGTTVTDEIVIKNTSCGSITDIKVNKDGSFTYQPNSACYGKDNNKVTFDYEVKSLVTINGEVNTVISNTSTITIDLTKDNATIEDPTVTKTNDNGNETTSIKEAFNYTIDYTTIILNHVGSTTITIVDKLPYELDLDKTNLLDGGTYNKENKTITWNITVEDINSYKNQNNDIHIVKHITLYYKNVPTNVEKITNNVEVTTDINNQSVKATQETEVIKGNLKVEYIDKAGNTLLPAITSTGLIDSTYETSANNIITKDGIEYHLIATKLNGENISKTTNYSSKYINGTTTVTYIYYKVTGDINNDETNITKEGPNKVTSSNQEFDYKITYNTKIDNYIGNATVTIIDTLPYQIDEVKSKLDGGTYNKENKTITWIIPVENIDTSVSGTKKITIEKNIKLVFTNLNPEERSLTNIVKAKIETTKSNNEVTDDKTTELEIKGTVITYYKDTNNQIIAPTKTTTGLVGNDYTTEEKDITGYLFVRTEGNTSGKYIEGTIEVTYIYYKQDGTINEDSITKTGTNKVTSTTSPFDYEINYNGIITNYIGDATVTIKDTLPYAIDLEKSKLDGGTYEYKDGVATITWIDDVKDIDTNKDGNKTINIKKNIQVVYVGLEPTVREVTNTVVGTITTALTESTTKPATKVTAVEVKGNVITNYITTTNEVLADSITQNGLVGNDYTTEEKEFTDYELVKVVGEKTGKFTVEPIEITYIYYKETGEITNELLEKDGTEVVTSKNDKFNYTIHYETEINDYIGNATVTIVDKLPLAIDTTTSELNGGIYDEENLTITWEFTYNDINTYENNTYKVNIEKEITLVYENLDPTIDEITNEVKSNIKTEISEKNNEDETTTKIDINGTVKVKYIDEEGNELADTITMTGKVGSEYTTEKKEFDGYDLLLIEGEVTGQYVEEEQTVTYVYIKLGIGGDVEVLPPQTGVTETTNKLPINILTMLMTGILLIIKKFI